MPMDQELIEFNGQAKSLSEWSKIYSIDRGTLQSRIKKGWSTREALETKVGHNRGVKRKRKPGDRFGKLTIVKPYARKNRTGKSWYHECLCDCGNTVSVQSSNLKSSVGCGCSHIQRTSGIEDGDVFGKWKVVTAYYEMGAGHRWKHKCQCDCGNQAAVDGTILKRGRSKGCRPCADKSRELGGVESAKRQLFRQYKTGAANRGYEFNLTRDQLLSLTSDPCHYCGRPDSLKTSTAHKIDERKYYWVSNGIDRIDNNKGYEIDNCVSCCTTCNKMKLCQSKVEFLDKVKNIYLNHFNEVGEK